MQSARVSPDQLLSSSLLPSWSRSSSCNCLVEHHSHCASAGLTLVDTPHKISSRRCSGCAVSNDVRCLCSRQFQSSIGMTGKSSTESSLLLLLVGCRYHGGSLHVERHADGSLQSDRLQSLRFVSLFLCSLWSRRDILCSQVLLVEMNLPMWSNWFFTTRMRRPK